ncbi:sigma-70 family RNA polymerase sigma factor [Candidatus Woesearchaeota archaeon]|nr:MAG: sigma-70 family RNA polymerase sigma factor [Candidatus Woesearchaeota archaeon]
MTRSNYATESSSLSLYMRVLQRSSSGLPKSRVIELHKRMREGDVKARNELIESNLRLAFHLALKFWRRNGDLPVEDFVNEANTGLTRAMNTYDPATGAAISTYATFWIHKHLRDFAERTRTLVRVPRYIREKVTEQEACATESAPEWKTTAQEQAAKVLRSTTVSLSDAYDSLEEEIAACQERFTEGEAVSSLDRKKDINVLYAVLDALDPALRDVLERKFGLNGYDASTLNEIAKVYGKSKEWARKRVDEALRLIRKRFLAIRARK